MSVSLNVEPAQVYGESEGMLIDLILLILNRIPNESNNSNQYRPQIHSMTQK